MNEWMVAVAEHPFLPQTKKCALRRRQSKTRSMYWDGRWGNALNEERVKACLSFNFENYFRFVSFLTLASDYL